MGRTNDRTQNRITQQRFRDNNPGKNAWLAFNKRARKRNRPTISFEAFMKCRELGLIVLYTRSVGKKGYDWDRITEIANDFPFMTERRKLNDTRGLANGES